MNRKVLFVAAIFFGVSVSSVARAVVLTEPGVVVETGETSATVGTPQEEKLYAEGTKLMDEQRWVDAISTFDHVAAEKGKRAEAAIYWKAYSLEKLGRKEEARAVCDTLQMKQGMTSWKAECLALQVRSSLDVQRLAYLSRQTAEKAKLENLKINVGNVDLSGLNGYDFAYSSSGAERATSEDDIKILALNSLLRTDSAKALPILRELLHSNKPIEVRRQALFVLSRSKDPQAEKIIAEVATTKGDPALQRAAVQTLALNRGKEAGPALADIYRGSSDAGVKRAAINGLFITHDAARLVELARGEKDLNMKRDIVSQLAVMTDPAATDYMLELLK